MAQRRISSVVVVVVLAVACLARTTARAQAGTITGTVVLADGTGAFEERAYALSMELGLRALELEVAPGLVGEQRAAREQSARGLAADRGALATLWIEHGEHDVCAIAPSGPARCAMLPRSPSGVDVRVLAVLFGSVLDEVLAPSNVADAASVAQASSPPQTQAPQAYETWTSEPTSLSTPAEDLDARHASHDGAIHPYALTESSIGVVWSPGEQSNVAHLVQRLGAGLLLDSFRAEVMLGMGIDQSIDGNYRYAFTVDGQAFLAASLPVDSIAVDIGGVIGGVGHEHVSANVLSTTGMMTAFVIGAAIGLHAPDSRASFPFRARLEIGLFARPEPGRTAPFTHLALGIGFW